MIHIHTPEPFLKCTAEVDLALRTLGHLALCVNKRFVQMICLASFFDTSLFRDARRCWSTAEQLSLSVYGNLSGAPIMFIPH